MEGQLLEYKENNNLLKKILLEVSDIKNIMNSYYKFDIDSKIIKTRKELDLIKDTLRNIYKKDTKFKLLFRASSDGETVKSFHEHCDGIPNTLSIMQGIKGYIFGGYTESVWDSYSGCKSGNNQFLFSLDRMKVYMGKNGSTSICCGTQYGPYFCSSCGMYDYYFSKNNNDEQSNKPYKDFTEQYELTHGDVHFYGKEVEVFQVIFI